MVLTSCDCLNANLSANTCHLHVQKSCMCRFSVSATVRCVKGSRKPRAGEGWGPAMRLGEGKGRAGARAGGGRVVGAGRSIRRKG